MVLQKNRVGQTTVSVTSLSLGGSSLGNLGVVVSDADAAALLQHAWSAGIRYFDTAPHYGPGLSEQRMGAYFKGKARDSYVLSTGKITQS